MAGLRDDRRPVLAGGLCILYTLCVLLDIAELTPTKGALRQGVIVELDARLRAESNGRALDLRDASVGQLQQRFQVDTRQAERVGSTVQMLYAQAAGATPDRDTVRELRWAAALHEVGMIVSHHDHHRHSAYLVAHADIAGFSQTEQRRLSDLVLGQRGGLRKLADKLQSPEFACQVLCLRLAVIAHHARVDAADPSWRLRSGHELSFDRPPEPRMLYLLREEVSHWQRVGALRLKLVE